MVVTFLVVTNFCSGLWQLIIRQAQQHAADNGFEILEMA
jgi:hypothetical protein